LTATYDTPITNALRLLIRFWLEELTSPAPLWLQSAAFVEAWGEQVGQTKTLLQATP